MTTRRRAEQDKRHHTEERKDELGREDSEAVDQTGEREDNV